MMPADAATVILFLLLVPVLAGLMVAVVLGFLWRMRS